MKRVVVTGMGIISPLGDDVEAFFDALLAGKSGVRVHDFSWGTQLAAPVLSDVDAPFPKIKRLSMDRTTQLALLAVRQACAQSAVDGTPGAGTDSGIYWGTAMGGAGALENAYRELFINHSPRLRPMTIVAVMTNGATGQIGIDFGVRGPSYTYSSACSSSAVAIGEAYRAIRFGIVKSAITGGADALLTAGVMNAWASLQTLAKQDEQHPETSCRPFSADRSGFVLGEGAGALVLEEEETARARGATILAEIIGYGNSTDAAHIAQPDAEGQSRAMNQAIADANIAPGQVQHINAHGTGTVVGDVIETNAIKNVFGVHAHAIPVSATKALHGHVMGGTGAIEFIATLQALRRQAVPPTAHLTHPDPQCDLDYVAEGQRRVEGLEVAMCNSFGFGGNNIALIARRYAR
ncbi:MAG TPA: beta-ketoacyl-[acyl-carrier-protein] synthase family protein [Burkholderiales bacterium]|nr:beta-ketoacyl-[acyl-carrier-protein] synthase family protein [Burkholderiales bacterium]